MERERGIRKRDGESAMKQEEWSKKGIRRRIGERERGIRKRNGEREE